MKITQKNVLFLISSNYMNTGVTINLLTRQKKYFMEKIMRLILDEVIMSYRHMSEG